MLPTVKASSATFQGGLEANGFKIPLVKGDEIFRIRVNDNRALVVSIVNLRWGLEANPRLYLMLIENFSSIVALKSLIVYAPPFQGGLLKLKFLDFPVVFYG